MPWEAKTTNGGFSKAQPWLPVPAEHLLSAVDLQLEMPQSVLRRYQDFCAGANTFQALKGRQHDLACGARTSVAFERQLGEERVLCVFNLSNTEARGVEKKFASATILNDITLTIDPDEFCVLGHRAASRRCCV